MHAESHNNTHSRQQSQLEEVKQSLNRLTLNFKSKELQQQYEHQINKQKSRQLLKIYFLLTVVSTIGIIQQAMQITEDIDKYLLIILTSSSIIQLFLSFMIRYYPMYSSIWNSIGIIAMNIIFIFTHFQQTDDFDFEGISGFLFLCGIIIFILLRYICNFGYVLMCLIISFFTICLILSYQFFGFMGICLIIALYNFYQSEYLQKQAFWFERFNYQQNHIIENVVTSSLFYIRYNSKEERLEFQRGNKRFCDKFEVKDDESMRFFLKNTKISHQQQEEQTINSMWNSVNNTWKSSLDGLIHKKIKEQHDKIQTQNNIKAHMNQFKDMTIMNSVLKEKSQNNSISQPNNQFQTNIKNIIQPLSIIESNEQQSCQNSHISISQKIKKIINPKQPTRPITSTNQINLSHFDNQKEKGSLNENKDDGNSRQNLNLLSPTYLSKKNFLLSDDNGTNGTASKKPNADDTFTQEREEIREQIRQVNPKSSKLRRINSGFQNQTVPSPQIGLQRSFTWRNNTPETNVYKAKYVNAAGDKIKFLVRILIFEMNDTYLAVSIEKEDQIKKYKLLKSRLSFFESVFTQLVNECKNKSGLELNSLRQMIPLLMQVESQLNQQNNTKQSSTNQFSSQLISLNLELPHPTSNEKRFSKLNVPNNSKYIKYKSYEDINKKINDNNLGEIFAPILNQQDITGKNSSTTTTIPKNNQESQITSNNNNQNQINATNTHQVGVLKKPLTNYSSSFSQQIIKGVGFKNTAQDGSKRDSIQVNGSLTTAYTTQGTKAFDNSIQDKEVSKGSSPVADQMNSGESLSTHPILSQLNKTNQQQNQSQKISQNSIQLPNYEPCKKIKGKMLSNLNQLLYLTYSGRYSIMNFNYFFQFFKKRTHLEIFSSINLTALIDSVIQMFNQQFKQKKIQIITDYLDRETRISTDQNALRQIIFNLVQNALQNTPQNGYIAIKTESDPKYSDCIKLKVRNTYYQSSAERPQTPLPEKEDCKFRLEDMISYNKRNNRVNLGLRISQRLIKSIGPTDKIIFKSDKPDYFQVEFSLYCNLNVVQKGSYSVLPSQKVLHTSYAISQDKTNANNSEKGLNGSNNLHAIQTEGGTIEQQSKKNLISLFQSAFKSQSNPFYNQNQDRILNSDDSFDSFVDNQVQQPPKNNFERNTLSADRFKHLV